MIFPRWFLALGAALLLPGCVNMQGNRGRERWTARRHSSVIGTGSSSPRLRFRRTAGPAIRQVSAPVEMPEGAGLRAPGARTNRKRAPASVCDARVALGGKRFRTGHRRASQAHPGSLHGHEATELDQQSLLTLLEDANRSFDVLVIRTQTALPYSSVFLELRPGYWDADSESRLRDRIERERMQRLVRPFP